MSIDRKETGPNPQIPTYRNKMLEYTPVAKYKDIYTIWGTGDQPVVAERIQSRRKTEKDSTINYYFLDGREHSTSIYANNHSEYVTLQMIANPIINLKQSSTLLGEAGYSPKDGKCQYLCLIHTWDDTEKPVMSIAQWDLQLNTLLVFSSIERYNSGIPSSSNKIIRNKYEKTIGQDTFSFQYPPEESTLKVIAKSFQRERKMIVPRTIDLNTFDLLFSQKDWILDMDLLEKTTSLQYNIT